MPSSNEAVLFFGDGHVDKEILYPEFEAILDGFMNFDAYAGREVRAAFVQINPRLKIQGIVFFLIGFDDEGRVLPTWNIPLQHLVDHATSGPDLGAGPARVACRSNCPVSWYRDHLWDPDVGEGSNTFEILRAAIERNRLGLVQRKAPEEEASAKPSPDRSADAVEIKGRYEQQLEEQQHQHELALRSQADRLKRHMEKVQEDYTAKLREQDETLEKLRRKLLQSRRKELELKELLGSSEQRFKKIQELYEDSVRRGSEEQANQLDVLRQQLDAELQQRLHEQAEELNERLSMHEVELHYRDEQLAKLRQDLSQLRRENQMLMQSEGGQILRRMTDSGITFVAYHPGIEHLVLAPSEITDYLKAPVAFVAERCGVSEDHYREWLMHYRLPVCRDTDESGECCGQPVDKVLKPQFFRPGDSDRCVEHRKARVEELAVEHTPER